MNRIIGLLLLFFVNVLMAGATPTIVILGDSLVAGYNVDQSKSLAPQLQNVLSTSGYSAHVINGGVSGDTSAGALTRLSWTIDRYQPDQMIVAIGGNDLLRGLPVGHTERNLRMIIKKLQSNQIKVILTSVVSLGYLDQAYSEAVNMLYPRLAQEFQIPLYPFLLLSLVDQPDKDLLMQPDGIHPTQKGIRLIAQDLGEFVIEQHWLEPNDA